MSFLKTDTEAGIYLKQDKPPSNETFPCAADAIKEIVRDRLKRILFEIKRIFGEFIFAFSRLFHGISPQTMSKSAR
jgi:hypothetical protein